MSVVTDIRDRIVPELRRLGEDVHFVPGWETRGAAPMARVVGQLCHHDAVPASAGPIGGLRICTFGRPDLRNSLCMFYVGSDASIWVVAAGVSWHAGVGDLASNYTWSGIEARNDGLGEPWPDAQLRAYANLNMVCARVWGYGAANVRDHKEHAPTRKIDRARIDPRMWRERIQALLDGAPQPQPIPPDPAPIDEEIAMQGVFIRPASGPHAPHTYLAWLSSAGLRRQYVPSQGAIGQLVTVGAARSAKVYTVGEDLFGMYRPIEGES